MFCSKCGVANPDDAKFCLACGHHLNGEVMPETVADFQYAGFWARFAASFIDSLVVMLVSVLCGLVLGVIAGLSGAKDSAIITGLTYVVVYGVSAYYFSKMESGERGATYGKRLLGLQVLDVSGSRATWPQAFGRWAAHFLSYITLYIGFFMQVFTKRRQALHDIVSQTIVVNTGEKKNSTAVVVGIAIAFLGIVVLGILAAIAIPAYQDYVNRAKTAEAYKSAQGAASVVGLYYMRNGSMPLSLQEAGYQVALPQQVESLKFNPDNAVIAVTMAADGGVVAGKQIVLTPFRDKDGSVVWACASESIPTRLLPHACRK